MNYSQFERIQVDVEDRIISATFDNPPMNLLDAVMFDELDRLTLAVASDPMPVVLIFKSADPDFFIAHGEIARIYEFGHVQVETDLSSFDVNQLQNICERVRTMNKVSIVQVEGRAGGAGAELASACDMRFGAIGKAVF